METETVTAEAVETAVTSEPQAQAAGKTPAELQAELERVEKALKEANREAAQRRKKLEEFEKAEQARKDAELSELEKAKKDLAELQTSLQAERRARLQREIADEVGLPPVLAGRLVGDDRDAMLADAKALAETLPKKSAPALAATNPGGQSGQGETDEQRRRRLGLA